ncbi:MAG: 30S ribosomal protein S4 [Acidobacteriota bacterium]|nr:30S ribosomal protein S4 [Acidobacteriota bacterium]MDE3262564.1 30S ribosomal protein S4 [Acidobacteriota bacterium]
MARYRGPVCRLCRREGAKLFLKGDRCLSPKCAIDKRNFAPGAHGKTRRSRVQGYGLQLREKQKAKRAYGLLERQFRLYFDRAERERAVTGTFLLQLLERRLDNAVYRLGLAPSRAAARLFVRHGHVEVNGKRVDIPSKIIDQGDVIRVCDKTRKKDFFKLVLERAEGRTVPEWLQREEDDMASGRVVTLPSGEDPQLKIRDQLIVELYSR